MKIWNQESFHYWEEVNFIVVIDKKVRNLLVRPGQGGYRKLSIEQHELLIRPLKVKLLNIMS